jgi:hypothetical protein
MSTYVSVEANAVRGLRIATTVFALTTLIHNSDHLRRGGSSVSGSVFWIGMLAIVLEVGLVWLVFADHPIGPTAATLGGLALAAGYCFVHFTPARIWLSDSFISRGVSPWSIGAAGLETVGALTMALVALHLLRSHDGADVRQSRRPSAWLSTLRHPVVAATFIGNAIIFAGSFATR